MPKLKETQKLSPYATKPLLVHDRTRELDTRKVQSNPRKRTNEIPTKLALLCTVAIGVDVVQFLLMPSPEPTPVHEPMNRTSLPSVTPIRDTTPTYVPTEAIPTPTYVPTEAIPTPTYVPTTVISVFDGRNNAPLTTDPTVADQKDKKKKSTLY